MRFLIFAPMKLSGYYSELLFVIMLFLISSCSNTSGLTSEQFEKLKSNTSGNWISSAWLEAVHEAGSPSGGRTIPCMEIIVSAKLDSLAWIEPGKELKVFPIMLQNDSSFMAKISDNTLTFFYSADLKTMFFNDGKNTTRLKKLPARYAVLSLRGWMSGLTLFLNEDQVAGEYKLIDDTGDEPSLCALTAYGEVHGLAGYKNYRLCYGGSCLAQSDEDVITLSDEKSADRYIWKWERDTLKFYSVRNTGTLEQPALVAHDVMFKLVKK